VSYRSWLQDVKHVQDLGSHCRGLVDDYILHDDERFIENDLRWLELSKRELPIHEEFRPFFGSRMHDAYVLGAERENELFSLKLNCRIAEGFVYCMEVWLGLDLPEIVFPVSLVCHDVKYVRWARHNKRGYFTHARPNWDAANRSSHTLLRDWFEEQDDRVYWISMLSCPGYDEVFGSNLFAMVDCKTVSAVDGRVNAVKAAFGDELSGLWSVYQEINLDGYSGKVDPVDRLAEEAEKMGVSAEALKAKLQARIVDQENR
jgi:hypothetical protein